MTTFRVYPAYVKGEPEEIFAIEKMFIEVWAALGISKTKTINRAFSEGLRVLADSKELEGKIDSRSLAIFKKWQEIQAKISERSQLELIYEHTDPQEFQEFCNKNDIDYEAFLQRYRLDLPSNKAKSKVLDDWIRYYLADGNEADVHDIRDMAETEGIIASEDDWNLMKNIASRNGYSGSARRGYWKLINS